MKTYHGHKVHIYEELQGRVFFRYIVGGSWIASSCRPEEFDIYVPIGTKTGSTEPIPVIIDGELRK